MDAPMFAPEVNQFIYGCLAVIVGSAATSWTVGFLVGRAMRSDTDE